MSDSTTTVTARFVPRGSRGRRTFVVIEACALLALAPVTVAYFVERWNAPDTQAHLGTASMTIGFCVVMFVWAATSLYALPTDGRIELTHTTSAPTAPEATPARERRLPPPLVSMPLPPRIITKTVVEEQVVYRTKPPELEVTDVYRLYGDGRRLLYVGITGNLDARMKQHAESKRSRESTCGVTRSDTKPWPWSTPR